MGVGIFTRTKKSGLPKLLCCSHALRSDQNFVLPPDICAKKVPFVLMGAKVERRVKCAKNRGRGPPSAPAEISPITTNLNLSHSTLTTSTNCIKPHSTSPILPRPFNHPLLYNFSNLGWVVATCCRLCMGSILHL